MAQDNQKQPQNQQPARQQPTPDSPFYSKSNMPENCQPMARWLFGKDWQCLGDPNWESAQWYAPGAPEVETQHTEPKFHYVRRMVGRDQNGNPIVKPVREQMMQQDGSNPQNMGQPTIKVEQLVITPPAEGIHYRQAVEIQRARDAAAKRKQTAVAA